MKLYKYFGQNQKELSHSYNWWWIEIGKGNIVFRINIYATDTNTHLELIFLCAERELVFEKISLLVIGKEHVWFYHQEWKDSVSDTMLSSEGWSSLFFKYESGFFERGQVHFQTSLS